MRVLVSGSSGFIGSAVVATLGSSGHQVVRLVRGPTSRPGETVSWDPARGRLDASSLTGIDAAVHLAGESIIGRWTASKKAAIRDSRTRGTQLLSDALATLPHPPAVLVSASAMGYYGDRGDETLDESSAPGSGFLAEVCRAWEAATAAASRRGIRVVHARLGMVLDPDGGALAKMLPAFRLGLGGQLGSGRQWMSWVTRDDVVGAIAHALSDTSLGGPVNVVSPTPVTNAEFTHALSRALRRPAVVPVPAAAIRLLFGEMGGELLLASARVMPKRLLERGYRFRHAQLEPALTDLLRRPQR